jgi:ubiquinone/menaquinone biosynthesis C-methylase UbiE
MTTENEDQIALINEIHKSSLYKLDDKDPAITGRSWKLYRRHLFSDLKTEKDFWNHFKNKDFLDIGCGINHIYEESLINKVTNASSARGLDIHHYRTNNTNYIKSDVFELSLKHIDIITINNFLYYWIDDPKKLLMIYKKMYAALNKGGEIRIYPVFFGNYHFENPELKKYLDSHFDVTLHPVHYYSETQVYLKKPSYFETFFGKKASDYELVNASVFTWLNVWQEKDDNETLKATLVKLVKK